LVFFFCTLALSSEIEQAQSVIDAKVAEIYLENETIKVMAPKARKEE